MLTFANVLAVIEKLVELGHTLETVLAEASKIADLFKSGLSVAQVVAALQSILNAKSN